MAREGWVISAALVMAFLLVCLGASAQGADTTLEEGGLNEGTESAVEDDLSSTKPNRAPGRDWHFFIAPYGWLAGTGGTVVTNGDEIHIDASFPDLAENTRGGFQVYFEARHKK